MLPWHSYVQMLPSGIDSHVKDSSFFYFVHYIMHSTNAWEYVPVRVQDIRLDMTICVLIVTCGLYLSGLMAEQGPTIPDLI